MGLGLGPSFFHKFCDKKEHNLRLLHYPAVEKSILDKESQARAG
jgi:isopenicillin N synthase-like dioxygenase